MFAFQPSPPISSWRDTPFEDKGQEMSKFYTTKYALTQGIEEVEGCHIRESGKGRMLVCLPPDNPSKGWSYEAYYHGEG